MGGGIAQVAAQSGVEVLLADATPELARKGRYLAPGLRLPSSGRMLDTVARAVLEQRVTGIEAKRAWRYLLLRYGDAAPGAGGAAPAALRLPPTAEQWRRVPSWEWHKAGVDAQRSSTVLKAAHVATGLERLASLPGGDAVRTGLRSVSGIGVWTVAEVVQKSSNVGTVKMAMQMPAREMWDLFSREAIRSASS